MKNFIASFAVSASMLTPSFAAAETLNEVFRLVEKNNYSLSAIGFQKQEKEFRTQEIASEKLPSLSLEVGADNSRSADGYVSVRQVISSFGRIDAKLNRSIHEAKLKEAELAAQKAKLLQEVTDAYGEALIAKRKVHVLAEQYESMEALLEQVKRRANSGLASIADVRIAAVRLIEVKTDQASADSEYKQALARLRQFTVVPIKSVSPVDIKTSMLPKGEKIAQMAKKSNLELRYRREAVAQIELQLQETKLENRPNLFGKINHSLSSKDTSVGIYIGYDLGGLGKTSKSKIAAVQAQLAAARQQYLHTEIGIETTAMALANGIAVDEMLVEMNAEAVTSLQSTVESYQRLYQAGEKSWLDLINIYREFSSKQLEQAQLESQLDASRIKLSNFLGLL